MNIEFDSTTNAEIIIYSTYNTDNDDKMAVATQKKKHIEAISRPTDIPS